MTTPIPGSAAAVFPLGSFLAAIGEPMRWAILRELSAGEPLRVLELAERLKCSSSLISKHLAVLRRERMVAYGRAGMYLIPAPYIVSTTDRHVDYGHCLLRLNHQP